MPEYINDAIQSEKEAAENIQKIQQQSDTARAAYQEAMGDQDVSRYKQQKENKLPLRSGNASTLLAGTFGGKYIGNVPIFANVDVATPFTAIQERDQQLQPPLKWKEMKKVEFKSTNKRYGDFLNEWWGQESNNYINSITGEFGHGLSSYVAYSEKYEEGQRGINMHRQFQKINNRLGAVAESFDKPDAELMASNYLPEWWFKAREGYRNSARSPEEMQKFLLKLANDDAWYNDLLDAQDVATKAEDLVENNMKDYFRTNATRLGWSTEDMQHIKNGDFDLLYMDENKINVDDIIDGIRLQGTNAEVYGFSKMEDPNRPGRFVRQTADGKVNLVSIITSRFPDNIQHKFVKANAGTNVSVNVAPEKIQPQEFTADNSYKGYASYGMNIDPNTGRKNNPGIANIIESTNFHEGYGVVGDVFSNISSSGKVTYTHSFDAKGMTNMFSKVYHKDHEAMGTPPQFLANQTEAGAGYTFIRRASGGDVEVKTKEYEKRATNLKRILESPIITAENPEGVTKTHRDNVFFKMVGGVPINIAEKGKPSVIITQTNRDANTDRLTSVSIGGRGSEGSTQAVILTGEYLSAPQHDSRGNVEMNITPIGIGGKTYTVVKGAFIKYDEEGNVEGLYSSKTDGSVSRIALQTQTGETTISTSDLAMETMLKNAQDRAYGDLFNETVWDSTNDRLATSQPTAVSAQSTPFAKSSKWGITKDMANNPFQYAEGKQTTKSLNNLWIDAETNKSLKVSELPTNDKEFMEIVYIYKENKENLSEKGINNFFEFFNNETRDNYLATWRTEGSLPDSIIVHSLFSALNKE